MPFIMTVGAGLAYSAFFDVPWSKMPAGSSAYGRAGSLVALIVSITSWTRRHQLLPMLPFVLPCLRPGSHEMGRKRWDRNRGRKKKKQGSLGLLDFTSQVFLPLVALSICWRIQWFKMSCFSLVNRVNGALLPATLNITPSRKIPSMLGIRQLLIKKWSFGSFALLTPTSYLGINENRTNAIQQIDRSELKVYYCGQ